MNTQQMQSSPSRQPHGAHPAADNGAPALSARMFALLVIAGCVLLYLTSGRYIIPALAWVSAAPLLAALHFNASRKRHLWLLAALLLAIHLSVAKIVTPPLSYIMAPMFALPAALGLFAIVALAGAAHRRLGAAWGIYAFPAFIAAGEWVLYSFTPQSSWGSFAYTQADNLALVQTASLAGIAGVSFLVALGSSVTAAAFTQGAHAVRWHLALFAALFVAAHLYGELRLTTDNPVAPSRIAAVSSAVPVEEIRGIIANPSLARKYDDEFFRRTAVAADRGALVAVWNEGATFMLPEEEAPFVERAKRVAMEKKVDIVLAYGVKRGEDPLRFENKYLYVRSDGTIADEYWKQHPVPGEGSIAGTAPAEVIDTPAGKISGAICFDYDFPHVARENATMGAALAVLPSSDWKGIDPFHSAMARFNAVAAGISLVRSVRAATSFASDPYGRVVAAMRFGEPGDGVMVADVPVYKVETLYAKTGDVFAVAAALFSALVLALLAWRWRAARSG